MNAGGIATATGGGPGGPGGARKVRNQRATAASRIEMPASSISRLCVSGWRTAATPSANTTAKNRMPLSGTIENAIPASVWPTATARFIEATATRNPKIVIAVASDTPISPTARCRAICPDDASQAWNTKNTDQAKKTTP